MANIELRVQNPMTHTTANGKFTSYLIYIETDNLAFSLKKSNIRRRYSEFVWFRDVLVKNHPDITPPALPPKNFFKDRFDLELIEQRKTGLELFLHGVVSETRYLSDNTVHLFLQSPLSVESIENFLKNPHHKSVADVITEHAQKVQGICQDCHRELYPSEISAKRIPAGDGLAEISDSSTSCPHDIFSPTRPHSFDFSHCVMGHSMSYDSTEEGSSLNNMAANIDHD